MADTEPAGTVIIYSRGDLMKMTFGQKAAAWAVVQALFAGCGGGGSASPAPSPAPAPAPAAPTISAQPTDATVLTGDTATFSVTASGTGVTYQWKKNGTAIAGATSSTYTAPAAAWGDDGAQYVVVVSNSGGGAVTSNAATEHLKLSADQQAFESVALLGGGGSYEALWNLNYTGSQSAASNYLFYDFATTPASPLTHGPQFTTQQAPVNMTKTLGVPASGPTRVLKNGAVLLVPGYQDSFNISYVGSGVQVDNLASDNKTVAYSQMRTNFSIVALAGLVHAAPAEFANPYNSVFANPAVLDTATSWAAGSAYMKFTATNLGDRYDVFDCSGSTSGSSPNPCNSGTTLEAAMAAGETSNSDGTTYHTADGTVSVVGGVKIWVAGQPRPQWSVNAYTVEYRIYFELNGNVYTGSLIKDGTVMSGFRYRSVPSDPTSATVYLDYQVRLNSVATHCLAAASLL